SSPVSEPPPNPLIFETPPKALPAAANETIALAEQPRRFPRKFVFLFAGLAIAAVVLVAVIFAWLLPLDAGSDHPLDAPAGTENKEDDDTTVPSDPETSKPEASGKPSSPDPFAMRHRSETTEEELRREVAQFPEVSLDRGDDRTEAQRIPQLAATAAREGTR